MFTICLGWKEIPNYALSLKQPWAELILQGKKTIEIRTWETKFRGSFYIHASKQVDLEACGFFGIDPASLVTGCIVGSATLSDVKEYFSEEGFLSDGLKHRVNFYGFSRPRFGFLLKDVKRLTPIPMKGALNFFKVDEKWVQEQELRINQ